MKGIHSLIRYGFIFIGWPVSVLSQSGKMDGSVSQDTNVTVSPLYSDTAKWNAVQQPFLDMTELLYDRWVQSGRAYDKSGLSEDSLASKIYGGLIHLISERRDEFNLKYAREHIPSPVVLYVLGSVNMRKYEKDAMEIFDQLPPSVRNSPQGQELAKNFKLIPGKQGPDFTLPDTSGKLISVSSLRGKYVLIDFWASWCAPCRRESPFLVKAFNKYNAHFTILSVSLDGATEDPKKSWMDAIRQDGTDKWAHVSELSRLKFNTKAAILYGPITGIPTNFLLDPEGKIVAKNLFGEALGNKLKELIH